MMFDVVRELEYDRLMSGVQERIDYLYRLEARWVVLFDKDDS